MERPKDIRIHRKDHSTVTIECNEYIARELYQYFSAFANNHYFHPLVKAKIWDGRIRFFKISTNELPIGLVFKVFEFAKNGGYTIECTFQQKNKITREELQRFIDSLGLPEDRKIRPYQFEAIYGCLTDKSKNVLISTAGGKSLVIYIVCRFMMLFKKKVLLICSKTSLVEQMFNDFKDYGFDSERYCHRIYGGQRKFYDAPVIISTWQSLITPKVKEDNPYEDFDCLICDEVHEAAKDTGSIQKVSSYCVNAEYRYGFSGTYPEGGTTADWFAIVGSFGEIKEYATYKHLQDNGYISKLKLYSLILEYDNDFKRFVYTECEKAKKGPERAALQNELIYANIKRNEFMMKMTANLKGNVLILFTKKSKHGYILREEFEKRFGDRVLYIDGDTPLEDREDVRKLLETRSDLILLATYGTLAAGWNVKNLMNVIFASGYKSRIKVLQSIGRSLRLHPDKDFARLFDLVDNVSFKDRVNEITFINSAYKHYYDRKDIYEKQGWTIKEELFKI